jgi:hypothetical protein
MILKTDVWIREYSRDTGFYFIFNPEIGSEYESLKELDADYYSLTYDDKYVKFYKGNGVDGWSLPWYDYNLTPKIYRFIFKTIFEKEM